MRQALLAAWLFAVCSAFAEDAALRLRDQYAVGDTMHLIVENTASVPRAAKLSALQRVSDAFAPPLWWSRAEPEILPPGTRGRVSFSARRPAQIDGDFDLTLGGEVLRATLHLAPTPGPLVVAHVLDLRGSLAIFLQNNGSDSLLVDTLTLDGHPLEIDPARSMPQIFPCDTGVITANVGQGTLPFAPDQAVLLGIGSAAGLQFRHAYVFRPPLVSVRQGEVPDAFMCPTHRHGPLDRSARELFALQRNALGLEPEVHFCRNRLPEGLNALGQCVPRAIVNAQGSNPARGTADAWRGLAEVLAHARTRTQPSIFTALIEPGSNFDGHYGQLASATVNPMSPRDLKYTIYNALGHGAKGLVFRLGDAPSAEYRAMADTITDTMAVIAPWLETSEPVSLGATSDQPDVSVTTLYAGRNALLVLTTRAPGTIEAAPQPGTLLLQRPYWFAPRVALEVGGAWHEEHLTDTAETLMLRDSGLDDVSMLLVYGE